MEEAVRGQQVAPQGQPDLGAAVFDRDELDPEQRGKCSLRRALEIARVYLPGCDDTNLATAVICASVSTPLNAGMTPPPCSICAFAIANAGLS